MLIPPVRITNRLTKSCYLSPDWSNMNTLVNLPRHLIDIQPHPVPFDPPPNVMSIVAKIDEIFYTITNFQKIDIALFTETWLKNTVPSAAINMAGYNLYRRNRINRMHSGVCVFITFKMCSY